MIKIINRFDNTTRNILKNLLNLSFLKFLNYFIPLITVPYIIRIIGISNFGLIGLGQALSVYFTLFFNFGINVIAPKEIAINKDNKKKLSKLFSIFYSAKFILLFLSFFLLLISYFLFPFVESNFLLFFLFFISSFAFSLFPSFFFIGIEKAKYITSITTPFSLISVVLIFTLIKEPKDYIYIPIISILGGTVVSIIAFFIVIYKFKIRFSTFKFKEGFQMIKRLTPFFLSRLSINFYTSSGIIILGILTKNNEIAGQYSIAEKVIKLLKDVFSPIYEATLPYFSQLFKNNPKKGFLKIKQFLKAGLLINFLIMLILIFFRKWIIIFFSGSTNRISEISLILLSTILLLVYPAVIIGRNCFIPLKLEKEFNLSVIYGAITYSITLIMLFIVYIFFRPSNFLIILIVLISSIITEAVIFFYRFFIFYKISKRGL